MVFLRNAFLRDATQTQTDRERLWYPLSCFHFWRPILRIRLRFSSLGAGRALQLPCCLITAFLRGGMVVFIPRW